MRFVARYILTGAALVIGVAGCGGGNDNPPDNAPTTYRIFGTVSGLTGVLALENNGGDALQITGNGPFAFSTPLAVGSGYSVTVKLQPPNQTCSVGNGSGTVSGSTPLVSVACTTNTYAVGGTISGLSGTVVLQLDGGPTLSLSGNGEFSFPSVLPYGVSYDVAVSTQPTGQTCAVSGGSGLVTGTVTNVSIVCSTNP